MLKSAKGAEPEYELKHRITGAIILVAAAVLVIPMLLSGPDPEGDGDLRNPAREASSQSRIVPLDLSEILPASGEGGEDLPLAAMEDQQPTLLDLTENNDGGITQTESRTGPDQGEDARDESARPALVMTRIPDTPEEQAEAQARADTAAKAEGQGDWFVRVGTFSKPANAERVFELLTENGYAPKRTPVSASGGSSTRVWLGPYAEKKAIEVSNRMKDLVGEKGYVTKDSS